MKTRLIAVVIAAGGLAALAQPASACPAGYEPVWIQGHMVCKLKTPKLPLKVKEKREFSGGMAKLKRKN